MGYRSSKNPVNKAPLRTVTGRGNDPMYGVIGCERLLVAEKIEFAVEDHARPDLNTKNSQS